MKPSTTSNNRAKSNRVKSIFFHALAIAFWIAVWEALALRINSSLIIAAPSDVVKRLCSMAFESETYKSLGFSLVRIGLGFLSALIFGSVLAVIAAKFAPVRTLLSPITTIIKSTPVASFVILAIIWFGSRNLSVFISFLMVFPVIYLNILKGAQSAGKELSEMADIYSMPVLKRIFYVLLPQIMPFVISACSVGLGLCWKSGVAAEVIGISTGSIGEQLYRAKLYFETEDLLAWTVLIIVISTVLEKTVLFILEKLADLPAKRFAKKNCIKKYSGRADGKNAAAPLTGSILLKDISKGYNGAEVINKLSLEIKTGEHIAIMGHSGAGKTTLTRLIIGIEQPDGGSIELPGSPSFAAVFQEDRLVESISAIGNLIIAGCDGEKAYEILRAFGFGDDLIFKPSRVLSGGEKRRCAIARALLYGGDIVIMDEPFKGIDAETVIGSVIPKVKELTAGKTLILITHSEEEADRLCERVVEIGAGD